MRGLATQTMIEVCHTDLELQLRCNADHHVQKGYRVDATADRKKHMLASKHHLVVPDVAPELLQIFIIDNS